MHIDLTQVASSLLALASAVIMAAIPIVVPAVMRRMKVANDASLVAKVVTAADAAAGVAYRYALAHEGGLASVSVHDAAVAAGARYVADALPQTLATLGITPAHVAAMVTARLGALLAADPTVTAGVPGPIAVAAPLMRPAEPAPVAGPPEAPTPPAAPAT